MRRAPAAALALALVLAASVAAAPALFTPWRAGESSEPDFQVQQLGADSYVIRQSIKTNLAAPFVYLLFGRDRALLLDSGAGGAALRPVVDRLVAEWSEAHQRAPVPLVVAHSHGHGDHVAGDAAFAARPDSVVVGLTPEAVAAFFGIADWPRGIGHIDLGGRDLAIIATPGHQPAHIMIFDPQTKTLLTGDALFPGRLAVPIDQFAAYRDSIDRAAAFARRHQVRRLLGAHIDMRRTPREDYASDAPVHFNEHVLELPPARLFELQRALHAMTGEPVRATHDDFIIVPRWPYEMLSARPS